MEAAQCGCGGSLLSLLLSLSLALSPPSLEVSNSDQNALRGAERERGRATVAVSDCLNGI